MCARGRKEKKKKIPLREGRMRVEVEFFLFEIHQIFLIQRVHFHISIFISFLRSKHTLLPRISFWPLLIAKEKKNLLLT